VTNAKNINNKHNEGKKMKLNIANLFKSKATKQEEENHRVQISEFENEINSAFEQMKQKGVDKLPLLITIPDEKDSAQTREEYMRELNEDWGSTDKKIYYPASTYSKSEIAVVKDNKYFLYEIIHLVSGNLSKELITSPWHTEEVSGNKKEGFEISRRYRIGEVVNIVANVNQNFVTKTAFYDKNGPNIKHFADMMYIVHLQPEELKHFIQSGIDEYISKIQTSSK
jgi:hypothetical protein